MDYKALAQRIGEVHSDANCEESVLERYHVLRRFTQSLLEECWKMEKPEDRFGVLPETVSSDLTQLQKQLAESYIGLDLAETTLKERKAAFDKENSPLTQYILDSKVLIEKQREEISRIILERFEADGVRPEYPLGLQVRSVPKIMDEQRLFSWSVENQMNEFLKLDEKAVKESLKENKVIFNSDGEVLAKLVEEPIPQIGEKTLRSWLDEQIYGETHAAEENIETEI